jgi:hypothetical protein
MSRPVFAGIVVAALAALGAVGHDSTPPSDDQKREFPSCRIACLDLAKVIKANRRFQYMMANIVPLSEQEKRAAAARAARLAAMSSAELKAEKERTKRHSDFNIDATLKKKDLMDRETKVYFAVYQDINKHVEHYAKEQGIGMIVRFNSDELSLNDEQPRAAIARALAKSIAYHNHLDITDQIIELCNGDSVPDGSDQQK